MKILTIQEKTIYSTSIVARNLCRCKINCLEPYEKKITNKKLINRFRNEWLKQNSDMCMLLVREIWAFWFRITKRGKKKRDVFRTTRPIRFDSKRNCSIINLPLERFCFAKQWMLYFRITKRGEKRYIFRTTRPIRIDSIQNSIHTKQICRLRWENRMKNRFAKIFDSATINQSKFIWWNSIKTLKKFIRYVK